jgi:hypothetical protein
LSKLASTSRSKDRFRERRAGDGSDSYAPASKVKRIRERPEE